MLHSIQIDKTQPTQPIKTETKSSRNGWVEQETHFSFVVSDNEIIFCKNSIITLSTSFLIFKISRAQIRIYEIYNFGHGDVCFLFSFISYSNYLF